MKKYIQYLFFIIVLGVHTCDSFGKDIYGKVLCEGKGLPGVVVTDGIDCTLTDGQGDYMLEKKRDTRFIYLTVPAGFVPAAERTIPLFFQKVDVSRSEYNFELKRNTRNDEKHLFWYKRMYK